MSYPTKGRRQPRFLDLGRDDERAPSDLGWMLRELGLFGAVDERESPFRVPHSCFPSFGSRLSGRGASRTLGLLSIRAQP